MDKWHDNKAWFLVLPVFIIVAFSAILPLMTVVNYAFQDIFGPGQRVFVGMEWFEEVLSDSRLHEALLRQFLFSGLVLLIEIPLGIVIALMMPKKGWGGLAQPGAHCPAALDSVERDRHHLDCLYPAGHRPFRGDHQRHGNSL